jgi:hypothetical protein
MVRSSRKTADIIRVYDYVQLVGRELERMSIGQIRNYVRRNTGIYLGYKSLTEICNLLKVRYEVR